MVNLLIESAGLKGGATGLNCCDSIRPELMVEAIALSERRIVRLIVVPTEDDHKSQEFVVSAKHIVFSISRKDYKPDTSAK